ncbi:MAG: bifunctional riboflavin kinase/FAD synthetase [Oscillospiraceae bacterium]
MQKKVIALGFFDGVHLGHRALLERTAARAKELGLTPAAFTFDRPPKEAVSGVPVPLINSPADRALLMRACGMEEVIVAPFDRAMMTMEWEDFIETLLLGVHHAAHLVAGHDFRFGYWNQGTPEKLAQKCRELGLGCDIIPAVQVDGVTVSSTYIRALLEKGETEAAARFLGHPHLLTQTVAHGRRIGRTIGIPTINFPAPEKLLLPADGVYATTVALPDGRRLSGVTNVGCRPTVNGTGRTVETFLLDFDGDLYGETVRLSFFRRLRGEEKFPSLEALRAQIQRDIRAAKESLAAAGETG